MPVTRWIDRGAVQQVGGRMLRPQDGIAVKYVVVIGHADDFAVYIGMPDATNEYVATFGDKVLEETARKIAPYCSHLVYRS